MPWLSWVRWCGVFASTLLLLIRMRPRWAPISKEGQFRLSGFVVGWFWAQMAVWGAVGRTHGGPKPQLDLWGGPVATEMPPWAVVGLNGAHFA